MTDQDLRTAQAAADIRQVGMTMQAVVARDMTLECYMHGRPSDEAILDMTIATDYVAKADMLLTSLGVSLRGLYN